MAQAEWSGRVSSRLMLLLALPAAVFYAVVFGLMLNLPLYDDYDAGLDFANHLTALPAGMARVLYFAAAQQNEYKIYFGHAFVWLELAVLGHLDFRVLSAIGDLFVLLLVYVLWKLFLPGEQDRARRLMLFLPVSFLLFQLQYWETLNWPLPGLQNIPVLGFSLGAIYLLGRRTSATWWGAAAAMLLAIAASGNGFLLLPIGLLMLLLNRRWIGLAGWIATGAATIWVYSYRYTRLPPAAGHGSMMRAILHPKVLYITAFLGSAGGFPLKLLAYPTGLALLAFMVWMVMRGYPRRNPVVCYCVLFVLLTSLAVAGIRSDGGLLQSLSSRYKAYSDLLLIFAYFAGAAEFLAGDRKPLQSNRLYRVLVGLAMLFWLGNVAYGVRALRMRDSWMKHGMALYEHPETRTGAPGPVYLQPQNDEAGWVQFELRARRELAESGANGIYVPPAY